MTPSKVCMDFIKKEEQCVLTAYKDIAGIPTIGWGSTRFADGKPIKMGDKITQTYADAMFEREVKDTGNAVKAMLVNTVVNQNQFDALVSFAYNCGTGALRGSTLIKRVRNNPNDPTIRDAFAMWNKITNSKTGKHEEAKGLTLRRKREANLYFTPVQ